MTRRPFSELAGKPVQLRRVPADVAERHGCGYTPDCVGVFDHKGVKLLAIVDFDDLFDEDGMRFAND